MPVTAAKIPVLRLAGFDKPIYCWERIYPAEKTSGICKWCSQGRNKENHES